MRAGISEPTRPDTARHSHCHLSVTTGPFSVSVLGPDEFSRLKPAPPSDGSSFEGIGMRSTRKGHA